MSIFATVRRLQHQHPVALCAMLGLLLAAVVFASMPRWVVHSHDTPHEAIAALSMELPGNHHVDDADMGASGVATFPDAPHDHAHYLGGMAATLPSSAGLFHPRFLREACPPWCDRCAPNGPQAPLHRPPIV